MNETNETNETNVIKQFRSRYTKITQKKIAKALNLSRWQLGRLESGECEIRNHIKETLWRLDHYLKNEGKIEDFKLPEYGEEEESN